MGSLAGSGASSPSERPNVAGGRGCGTRERALLKNRRARVHEKKKSHHNASPNSIRSSSLIEEGRLRAPAEEVEKCSNRTRVSVHFRIIVGQRPLGWVPHWRPEGTGANYCTPGGAAHRDTETRSDDRRCPTFSSQHPIPRCPRTRWSEPAGPRRGRDALAMVSRSPVAQKCWALRWRRRYLYKRAPVSRPRVVLPFPVVRSQVYQGILWQRSSSWNGKKKSA